MIKDILGEVFAKKILKKDNKLSKVQSEKNSLESEASLKVIAKMGLSFKTIALEFKKISKGFSQLVVIKGGKPTTGSNLGKDVADARANQQLSVQLQKSESDEGYGSGRGSRFSFSKLFELFVWGLMYLIGSIISAASALGELLSDAWSGLSTELVNLKDIIVKFFAEVDWFEIFKKSIKSFLKIISLGFIDEETAENIFNNTGTVIKGIIGGIGSFLFGAAKLLYKLAKPLAKWFALNVAGIDVKEVETRGNREKRDAYIKELQDTIPKLDKEIKELDVVKIQLEERIEDKKKIARENQITLENLHKRQGIFKKVAQKQPSARFGKKSEPAVPAIESAAIEERRDSIAGPRAPTPIAEPAAIEERRDSMAGPRAPAVPAIEPAAIEERRDSMAGPRAPTVAPEVPKPQPVSLEEFAKAAAAIEERRDSMAGPRAPTVAPSAPVPVPKPTPAKDVKITSGDDKVVYPITKGQAVIVSRFGLRQLKRKDGTYNIRLHPGLDYAGIPEGAPIQILTSAKVFFAGVLPSADKGYGNMIELILKNGEALRFGHLKDMFVERGQELQPGTVFATMGNTGESYGAHLHFEHLSQPGKFVKGTPPPHFLYDPIETEAASLIAMGGKPVRMVADQKYEAFREGGDGLAISKSSTSIGQLQREQSRIANPVIVNNTKINNTNVRTV